jgi:hypothetical protein
MNKRLAKNVVHSLMIFITWAAAVFATIALGIFLLSGCASPVTPEVMAALPPAQAQELAVHSTQHPHVWFDLRAPVHNLNTCPYLRLMPGLIMSAGDPQKRAWFVSWFYWQKHLQEGGCKCTALLSACNILGCPVN